MLFLIPEGPYSTSFLLHLPDQANRYAMALQAPDQSGMSALPAADQEAPGGDQSEGIEVEEMTDLLCSGEDGNLLQIDPEAVSPGYT